MFFVVACSHTRFFFIPLHHKLFYPISRMKRTFPSRIGIGDIVFVVCLIALTIYMMWSGGGLAIALSLLLVVLVVERTIHTEYSIDSHQLVVHYGRFGRDRTVNLDSICRVERIRRLRLGHRTLMTFLVVVCNDGTELSIRPRDEEDFVETLTKYVRNLQHDTTSHNEET